MKTMIVFIKQIIAMCFRLCMRVWGFRSGGSTLMLNAIKKDISNKGVPFRIKVWAWKRGFMGARVYTFGINEQNYRNQIPDFDYYKLHPINGNHSKWIDDKLTMKYILAHFNEYLPKYYFQIEDGEILKLPDCPNGIDPNVEGILDLFKLPGGEGNLALKPLAGSLGKGFYKLTCKDTMFFTNDKKTRLNEIKNLLKSLKGYLVTEYIMAHKEIRKIYEATPNTLRVQLIRDNNNPKITGACMRFGTSQSGLLETTAAGVIYANVGLSDGFIHEPKRVVNNLLENLHLHPDSKEILEIMLPHWEIIKEIVLEISNYLPQLSYLGFDIIITDKSFKIIEINSLSALTFLPYYFPFFEDKYSKTFFKRKFNERPRHFRRVLRNLTWLTQNDECS